MFDDPDFAYTYVRPVAVVSGFLIAMWLGAKFREWRDKRRERSTLHMRDITPK